MLIIQALKENQNSLFFKLKILLAHKKNLVYNNGNGSKWRTKINTRFGRTLRAASRSFWFAACPLSKNPWFSPRCSSISNNSI